MISGISEMPITDESYPFSSAERYCHLSAKATPSASIASMARPMCTVLPMKTAAWRS